MTLTTLVDVSNVKCSSICKEYKQRVSIKSLQSNISHECADYKEINYLAVALSLGHSHSYWNGTLVAKLLWKKLLNLTLELQTWLWITGRLSWSALRFYDWVSAFHRGANVATCLIIFCWQFNAACGLFNRGYKGAVQ